MVGLHDLKDAFDSNADACHQKDQGYAHGGQGFRLTVAIGMVFVGRFGRQRQAKKDETGQLLEDTVDAVLMARQCFSSRRLVRPTVLTDQELGGITRPVFFLVGENERLYSPGKAVERLSRVAPAVKTEVSPRAGHDLTFVQPELVNLKVIEFLDKS